MYERQRVEYTIKEPPTSGEVYERAMEAFYLGRSAVPMVLRGNFQVPRPVDVPVDMIIRTIDFSGEPPQVIAGMLGASNVVIDLAVDGAEPAVASVLVENGADAIGISRAE